MYLHKLCAVSTDRDLRVEAVDTYFLTAITNRYKAAVHIVPTVGITITHYVHFTGAVAIRAIDVNVLLRSVPRIACKRIGTNNFKIWLSL